MQRAFPGGGIEVTDKRAVTQSVTTVVATVDGVRKDVPAEGRAARDVAVECRFDNGILTGFRWTAGPLQQ